MDVTVPVSTIGWPLAAVSHEPVVRLTMMIIPTVIFVVYGALIWWGRRHLLSWINRSLVVHVQRLSSARLRRLGIRQLVSLSRIFVRLLSAMLLFGGAFLWLTALLDAITATRHLARQIERGVLERIIDLLQSGLGALPGLGIVALIYLVTRVVHEIGRHYFESIESGELNSDLWDAVTAQTTRRLAGVGLWIAALIIAYPYIPGSETAIFKGIGVLAGLMLSLGSTNLVGQLVSGLVLIYSRAVRPGDVVMVNSVEGVVETLGLFSCAVRTADEELVWLPNSAVAAGVRNRSRPREGSAVQFSTQVTIGYDTPWQKVRELLLSAATDAEGVQKEPAPFVRQAALEDFYVRYELVFSPVEPAKRKLVLSTLHERIQDRFKEAGVQIMSPHYRAIPAAVNLAPVVPLNGVPVTGLADQPEVGR